MLDTKFDNAFQKRMLGTLLRTSGILASVVNILKPNVFTVPVYVNVYKFLKKYWDKYNKVPEMFILLNKFPKNHNQIKRLYKVDIDTSSDYITGELVAFVKRQGLRDSILDYSIKLKNDDPTIQDTMIDDFQKVLSIDVDTDMGTDFTDFSGRIESIRKGPEYNKIRTGITHLDAAIGGGHSKGQLGIILGKPKGGKSFCLASMAHSAVSAKQGLNAVYFSHEMPEDQVLGRIDRRVTLMTQKDSYINVDKYAKRLKKRGERFIKGKLVVKTYPTRTTTVATMKRFLEDYQSIYNVKFDVIFVDYANIVKPALRTGDTRHEIAGVLEELRAMAVELDIAVWTAMQTNRGALDKEVIDMSDLAECFEAAHICDLMIAVCQSDEEKIAKKCRLFLALCREYEMGVIVTCLFDRSITKVKSLSTNKYTQKGRKNKASDDADDAGANYIARMSKKKKG